MDDDSDAYEYEDETSDAASSIEEVQGVLDNTEKRELEHFGVFDEGAWLLIQLDKYQHHFVRDVRATLRAIEAGEEDTPTPLRIWKFEPCMTFIERLLNVLLDRVTSLNLVMYDTNPAIVTTVMRILERRQRYDILAGLKISHSWDNVSCENILYFSCLLSPPWQLTRLSLSVIRQNNVITRLAQVLIKNTTLEFLKLNDIVIENLNEFSELFKALSCHPALLELDLEDIEWSGNCNSSDDDDNKWIDNDHEYGATPESWLPDIELVASIPKLTNLRLSRLRMGKPSMRALFAKLLSRVEEPLPLQLLQLNRIALVYESVFNPFWEWLKHPQCGLQELRWYHPIAGCVGNSLHVLLPLLSSNQSIQRLKYGDEELSKPAATWLSRWLSENTTLKEFTVPLWHPDLEEYWIPVLSGIAKNKTLEIFNLVQNDDDDFIDDDDLRSQLLVDAICNVVRTNTSLITFRVYPVYATLEKYNSYLDALQTNKTLKHIATFKVPSTDECLDLIPGFLDTNMTLERIDFDPTFESYWDIRDRQGESKIKQIHDQFTSIKPVFVRTPEDLRYVFATRNPWTERIHRHYPTEFKKIVLILLRILDARYLGCLPYDLVRMIIKLYAKNMIRDATRENRPGKPVKRECVFNDVYW